MNTGSVLKKSFEPLATSFLVVATTRLGAIGTKQTSKCFTGVRWGSCADTMYLQYRFSATQQRVVACDIATLAPSHPWTFAEAAAAILGVNTSIGYNLLAKLLIQYGHTLTLTQLEEMVESTKATATDKYANMRLDGHSNFAFVESNVQYNPVLVASVHKLGNLYWNTCAHKLDDRIYRSTDSRLMVRNLTLKR